MTTVETGVRPPQVLLLEQFVSVADLQNFKRVLLHEMEWVKETKYYPDARQHYTLKHDWVCGVTGNSASQELAALDVDLKHKIHPILQQHYAKLLFIPKNLSYNRWMVGDSISCHNDSGHPDGRLIIEKRGNEPPPTPISEHLNEVASVVYLTDDFEGGELYFNNYNYSVKPSAGTVISFPANHFYSHGVKELLRGERLTITLFWPGVKDICLSLVPEVYPDWWQRVHNPESIWTVIPGDHVSAVNPLLLPPKPNIT